MKLKSFQMLKTSPLGPHHIEMNMVIGNQWRPVVMIDNHK